MVLKATRYVLFEECLRLRVVPRRIRNVLEQRGQGIFISEEDSILLVFVLFCLCSTVIVLNSSYVTLPLQNAVLRAFQSCAVAFRVLGSIPTYLQKGLCTRSKQHIMSAYGNVLFKRALSFDS